MADKFSKLLANAQKNWKKASKRVKEDEGPEFQELPDGRYTAQLVGASIGESSNGRLQIDYDWVIQDGEYEGKHKHNYQGLESEDNLFYMGKDLTRLGYEVPDDLTDLPEIMKELAKEKPVASIFLKTKGDFQNVYIRKVFTAGEDEDEDEVEEEEDVEESDEEESDDEESDDEESDEESDEETDDEESDEEESDDEESDEEESDEDDADEESDEEESDEDEGDEVELTEGMTVMVETAKGREEGVIIGILEKEEKVRVELKNGKTVRVGPEAIEVIETKPAKKAKAAPAKKAPAKKPAPAPAKKKAAPAPAKGKKKTRR